MSFNLTSMLTSFNRPTMEVTSSNNDDRKNVNIKKPTMEVTNDRNDEFWGRESKLLVKQSEVLSWRKQSVRKSEASSRWDKSEGALRGRKSEGS